MNIPNRTRYSCPCCGGDIGDAPTIENVRTKITRPQAKIIFDLLSRTPGAPIEKKEIISHLYGDRFDGGPLDPGQTVNVQIYNLRKQLEKLGWTIINTSGGGRVAGEYRIIPAEVCA